MNPVLISPTQVDQFLHDFFAETKKQPTEDLPLHQLGGRVLAQPVYADRDHPPFPRAAMDGYALVGDQLTGTNRGILGAGVDPGTRLPDPQEIKPGDYLEIMTGAPVPPPFDRVVPYEDITELPERIELNPGQGLPIIGQNIHPQGADFVKDELVVPPGTLLTSGVVGILATLGYFHALVTSLPKIRLLSTGNELVSPKMSPEPWQIRASNPASLTTELRLNGLSAEASLVSDSIDEIRGALEKALGDSDILLLTGGVSRGKFDLVPGLLEELGVKIHFHGVAQKPGKPLLGGSFHRGNRSVLVLGLPGNPISSLVALRRYLLPALGHGLPVFVPLAIDVPRRKNLTLLLQGALSDEGMKPLKNNGSGDVSAPLFSWGIGEIPPGSEVAPKGTLIPFFLWGGNLGGRR